MKLPESPLFAGVESHDLKSMMHCLSAKERSYKKDEFIFHTGDSIHHIGMVLEGSVHMMKEDVWGNVIASSVDGIILMNDELSKEVYELIKYTPVPVVFVNGVSDKSEFGSVTIDNEKCGYDITKQMIDRGNKKIVFVTTHTSYLVNELKQKGYEKAMAEAGLTPKVFATTGDIHTNEKDFNEFLDQEIPEVALVVRDSIAISFMNVAQKKGIKVPDELQVIGFQNTKYAELSYPKLSCVDTPIYEIGSASMKELTDLMKNGEETKPQNLVVDYKFVWRDSTK